MARPSSLRSDYRGQRHCRYRRHARRAVELADAKRVACASERRYRAFRNTFQPVIVVAKHAGEWMARVEVIASTFLLYYSGVFLVERSSLPADLLTFGRA